jgi:sec-independent protein translocase protein TatC
MTRTTGEIKSGVNDTRMTLIEHLEELRQRLIKAIIALVVTTLFSLVFTRQLLLALIAPLGGVLPQAVRPTETFVTYMKVALMAGIALAMPVIIYQFIRFVVPGLTRRERRYLYILVPGATLLFLIGMAFCYFFMLPFAISYLHGFLSDVIRQDWTIDYYISFVTTFLLATGLVFETPLVVFFLAKLGVVTPATLKRNRKYAIVIAFVIAAVITPTPDPFNQTLVAGPLIILYEVGILLSRFA